MPDRSTYRGRMKCSSWSSRLGVGRGDYDQFTVTKSLQNSGGSQDPHSVLVPVKNRRLTKAQSLIPIFRTSATRLPSHFTSSGIFGGQCDTAESFLNVLRFTLSILNPSTAPYSSNIRGW
jgi:hypothetical protein